MRSSPKKRTALITGCSPGGMGAALAVALHKAGHTVYATARTPSKLSPLAQQGIKTLPLDITSPASIASAIDSVSAETAETGGLDILVNNAATSYSMPLADASLDEARKLFETNVWGHLAVTQAFLPLLLRAADSGGAGVGAAMVVNHTSVGSLTAMPFQGVYNASKAALAMLSETMRLELAPFGVRVVDLKTAGVRTNIVANSHANSNDRAEAEGGKEALLPRGSIYEPAREVLEKSLRQEGYVDSGHSPERWADEVSALLLGGNPPAVIWRGESAMLARVGIMVPSLSEGAIKKITRLDVVERMVKESRASKQ